MSTIISTVVLRFESSGFPIRFFSPLSTFLDACFSRPPLFAVRTRPSRFCRNNIRSLYSHEIRTPTGEDPPRNQRGPTVTSPRLSVYAFRYDCSVSTRFFFVANRFRRGENPDAYCSAAGSKSRKMRAKHLRKILRGSVMGRGGGAALLTYVRDAPVYYILQILYRRLRHLKTSFLFVFKFHAATGSSKRNLKRAVYRCVTSARFLRVLGHFEQSRIRGGRRALNVKDR